MIEGFLILLMLGLFTLIGKFFSVIFAIISFFAYIIYVFIISLFRIIWKILNFPFKLF